MKLKKINYKYITIAMYICIAMFQQPVEAFMSNEHHQQLCEQSFCGR